MTYDSVNVPGHLYFITATLCGWKPLFDDAPYQKIVLDSFAWLQAHSRWELFAFVIMPNHVHLIIRPIEIPIGDLLQDFGSYTAHIILKQLRAEKRQEDLNFFASEGNQIHQKIRIWQDIQAQNIYSREFLRQKLEYIHNNPVAKHWNLVENRADYPFSTAGYYDRAQEAIVPIHDIRVWL